MEEKNKINIELYNESCFDFLTKIEDNSVDLVLIDPPYEISQESAFSQGGVKRFAVSLDFGEWDKNFTGMDIVIKEAYRILRKGGTLISFYDLFKITYLKEYMEASKFKQIRFIEWLKTNPVPLNSRVNYLMNAREVALTGVKVGKGTFNSIYDSGVYRYPICHEKGRFHPTQKPLPLIKDLILKHSKEGDMVVDCFSGSGTTAVASALTGRNFKGCELDTGFYQKSIVRIEELNVDMNLTTMY